MSKATDLRGMQKLKGIKKYIKKRHKPHMARSEIRREGKVICKVSCGCAIPYPGSFSSVLGVNFFNACFQLEFGMRTG